MPADVVVDVVVRPPVAGAARGGLGVWRQGEEVSSPVGSLPMPAEPGCRDGVEPRRTVTFRTPSAGPAT
ncbi:protein of unassigned function [Methylobacterium oryzae CBMB20]|uniref:Protein of unassigned function n=1 Tax=Methylobacterium oryzae CBMB20 TaxID=693986 RepID=A0A089NQ95_9HYPH|nr:protein of unassigned function [Methylobacterium oryzae CBMB20]